ncbi:hypothetical protein [Aliikangiella coralliicola]|uniref:Uncharacterized protein n=1 Tax=Aliikangiella coralliicola TaxID=2592383 RepID=A0A545UEK4_9GAMM|nr:hypothetical protein [Aliikangiella coralliicola]TQV87909.1 hypothetical protein FLL46_11055 [Aliikangiella coralliicola]
MTEKIYDHYNVILTGSIKQGFDIEDVKTGVANLFKTSPQKISPLLNGNPTVIKRDIPHKKAYHYQQLLEKNGAETQIHRIVVQEKETTFTLVPEGEETTPYEELAEKQGHGEIVTCGNCHTEQLLAPYCTNCGTPLNESNILPSGQSAGMPIFIAIGFLLIVFGLADYGLYYLEIIDLTGIRWLPIPSAFLGFIFILLGKSDPPE